MTIKSIEFLKPILNHHLTNRVDGASRKTGCFHPSSLSKCHRHLYEHYLAKSHASSDVEPRIKRIFDNGHGVHSRIQTYYRNIGLLIDEDVLIYDNKYEICGEIDGLLKYWDELVIMDVKSINKDRFRKLYKPSEDYIVQLNVYMYCLGLKYGILLYECKDDQEITEFLVEYNPEVLVPIFQKIKKVKEYIANNIVPPREEHNDCRWCNYDKTCK